MRTEVIVNNLPDHIFIVSLLGDIVDAYEGEEVPFEFDVSKIIGKNIREIYSPHLATFFKECLRSSINSDGYLFFSYFIDCKELFIDSTNNKINEKQWFEGRVKALRRDGSKEVIFIWIVRNITRRVCGDKRLLNLASMDELTSIYNRRAFMNQLSIEFEQCKLYSKKSKFSILMLDIDYFKKINDEHGHLMGDKVIQHICQVCLSELRLQDVFGRLGGEEFAIMLKDTDSKQAHLLANRLLKKVKETPFIVNDKYIYTTISVGVTEFSRTDLNVLDVLRRADMAMYNSKERGRNRASEYSLTKSS
ncbi:sensor domain-containing diguanylate cyclase [Vibrio hannami]|uniref:sensor domain-containing diguanylate cyclase n=1 Tax=Vibrio hannami TaxID=2717094 RepID=UPI00240FB376|nr:sensor domain-containing diguanylate cyclase [Vibrio hannami]MDG3085558.1 sensor domain-containing diguanylate cyclase [Vibrio hannami]